MPLRVQSYSVISNVMATGAALASSPAPTTPEELEGGLGFRMWDVGFRVWSLGFRVKGSGFKIKDLEIRAQGLGSRV